MQQNYSDGEVWGSLPPGIQNRILDISSGLEIVVELMAENEKKQIANGSHYPVPHFENSGSEVKTYFQADGRFYRIHLKGDLEKIQNAGMKLVALTSGGINHTSVGYNPCRRNGDKLHHMGRRSGRRPPAYLFGRH